MRGARGRGLVPLQRLGANEPARSRRLTPRRLWRRGSCDGPRYEIFTLGSEDRNGGRGLTAVDVRTVSGAWRTPRPAPSPLTMCPSSPQAIRAAGARADQVGGGGCPKRQAEEELSYATQAISSDRNLRWVKWFATCRTARAACPRRTAPQHLPACPRPACPRPHHSSGPPHRMLKGSGPNSHWKARPCAMNARLFCALIRS